MIYLTVCIYKTNLQAFNKEKKHASRLGDLPQILNECILCISTEHNVLQDNVLCNFCVIQGDFRKFTEMKLETDFLTLKHSFHSFFFGYLMHHQELSISYWKFTYLLCSSLNSNKSFNLSEQSFLNVLCLPSSSYLYYYCFIITISFPLTKIQSTSKLQLKFNFFH